MLFNVEILKMQNYMQLHHVTLTNVFDYMIYLQDS